jgi:microcystin-dependent protein
VSKIRTAQGHVLIVEGDPSDPNDLVTKGYVDQQAGGGEVTIEGVTGLQTALDAKSDTHSHPYAADDHNHDSAYSAVDHTHPGGGSALDAWPVGSVYIAVDSTSPATRFGGGTWQAFGAGRMLVGLDSGDADFDTAEETGGAKTVTLTAAQSGLPQHTHTQNAHNHTQDAHTHQFLPRSGTTGSVSSIVTGTLDTSSTISGANQPHIQSATATNQAATAVNQNAGPTDASQAHSNVPPYIVVYMWKRTA